MLDEDLVMPDPIYAQFRDQTRFWVQRVAVPFIMVVGLFGNLITMIIMTRRRMRSTTNMYLAALAFVDMLYLVLTFLLGLSHYPNMAGRRYYLYWRLRPFLVMLTDTCSNTSVWLTVTFTIERFIAVKYPMRGKVWCTESRAKKLIACVFLFAIIFAAPVPFEWKVVEKRIERSSVKNKPSNESTLASSAITLAEKLELSGESRPNLERKSGTSNGQTNSEQHEKDIILNDDTYILSLENSDFGRNETYKTIYYWSTAFIFYFIPLLSLTFFNGFLIHSVHRSRRERNRMTTGQRTLTGGLHQQDAKNTTAQLESKLIAMNHNTKGVLRRGISMISPTKTELLHNGSRYARQSNLEGKAAATNHSIAPRSAILMKQDGIIEQEESVANQEAQMNSSAPTVSLKTTTNGLPEKTLSNGEESISSGKLGNSRAHPVNLASSTDGDECKLDGALVSKLNFDGNSSNKHFQETEHDSDQDELISVSCATISEKTVKSNSNRKVEFNCDHDDDDSNGLSDVRTDCDSTNHDNLCIEMWLMRENFIKKSSDASILAKIQRSATTSASPADTILQTNQLNCSRTDSGDLLGLKLAVTARARLDASKDNKLNSNPADALHLSSTESTTRHDSSNNGHDRRGNTSPHSNSKLHQLSSALSSGGLSISNSSNYENGSYTTAQTTNAIVPASSQERRITIMLIAVVILFLFCQIPSAAMLLYTSVHETLPNTNEHALLLAFGNVFNFLMAVNAAGNFILYSFLSKKYRRTFVILFCSCFKGGKGNADLKERHGPRTSYFSSTQPLSNHPSTSSSGLLDEAREAKGKRWTSVRPVSRPNLPPQTTSISERPAPQSKDLGNVNHVVGRKVVQLKRRDTLV